MADQQRKLLEQLMGNVDSHQEQVDLDDSNLCQPYCVDFCIHELFLGTRAHFGKCPYIHLERAKLVYEAHKAKQGPIEAFEKAFDSQLCRVLKSRQAVIEEQNRKIAPDAKEGQNGSLNDLVVQLEKAKREQELLGEELKIMGSHGIINEQLTRQLHTYTQGQREITNLQDKIDRQRDSLGFSAHLKLVVCPTCGSLLSSMEPDIRLADHFSGKLHRSYDTVATAAQARNLI